MSNFLHSFLGSSGEKSLTKDDVVIVVERLKSASDITDRKDAVKALLEAARAAAALVGPEAIPAAAALLRDGVGDEDVREGLLETLLALTTARSPEDRPAVGANTALLLTDHQNVVNMLDLLEDSDVHTTLLAIQLLDQLHQAAGPSLEATVLECPAGMLRLTDILQDRREEVRNAALLLLGRLLAASAEFRQFFAFNGGFGRLLAIARAEGLLREGSPVCLDALRALRHTLAGDDGGGGPARQLLLQAGAGPGGGDGLAELAPFLEVSVALPEENHQNAGDPDDEDEEDEEPMLSATQQDLVATALQVIHSLVAPLPPPKDPSLSAAEAAAAAARAGRAAAAARAAVVGHGRLFGALSELALPADGEEGDYPALQVGALRALAAAAAAPGGGEGEGGGGGGDRDTLLAALGDEALGRLVGAAMAAGDEEEGESNDVPGAAVALWGALYDGNEPACMQTLMHIIAPPPRIDEMGNELPPIEPPGKLLLARLAVAAGAITGGAAPPSAAAQARAEALVVRGCQLLAALLEGGGGAARAMAARVAVAAAAGGAAGGQGRGQGQGGPLLLPALVHWAYEALRAWGRPGPAAASQVRVGLAFLATLGVWCAGSHEAAAHILENPANLFLVDLAANGRIAAPGAAPLSQGREQGGSDAQTVEMQIKALSCMCLGFCMIHYDEKRGDGSWTKQRILDMIENKITIKMFTKVVNEFGESKELKTSYGPIFPTFYKKGSDAIREQMIGLYTGEGGGGGGEGGEGEGGGAAARLIADQEEELRALRARSGALAARLAALEGEEGRAAAAAARAEEDARAAAALAAATAAANAARAQAGEARLAADEAAKARRAAEGERARLEEELRGLALSHNALEAQLQAAGGGGGDGSDAAAMLARIAELEAQVQAAAAAGEGAAAEGEGPGGAEAEIALRARVAELEGEVADRKAVMEGYKQRLRALEEQQQQQAAAAAAQVEAGAGAEAEAERRRAQELGQQCAALQAANATMAQEIDELKAMVDQSSKLTPQLEEKDRVISTMETHLKEMEAQLSELVNSKSELESAAAEQTRVAEQMKDELQGQLASLEQEMKKLQEDAKAQLAEVEAKLKNDVALWEGKAKENKVECQALEENAKQLSASVEELKAQAEAKEAEVLALKTEAQNKAGELERMEKMGADQAAAVAEPERRAAQRTEEAAARLSDAEGLAALREEMAAGQQRFGEKLAQAEQQIKDLVQQREQQAKIQEESEAKLKADIQALKQQLAASQSEALLEKEALEAEQEALRNKLHEQVAGLAKAEEQKGTLASQQEQLQQQLQQQAAEAEGTRLELQQARAQAEQQTKIQEESEAKLKADIQALKQQLAASQSEALLEKEALEAEQEALRNNLHEQVAGLAKAEEQKGTLASQQEQLQQQLQQQAARLAELEQRNEALQQELRGTEGAEGAAAAAAEGLRERAGAAEEEAAAAREEARACREEAAAAQRALEEQELAAAAAAAARAAEAAALRGEIEALLAENTALGDVKLRLNEREARLRESEAELERSRGECADLARQAVEELREEEAAQRGGGGGGDGGGEDGGGGGDGRVAELEEELRRSREEIEKLAAEYNALQKAQSQTAESPEATGAEDVDCPAMAACQTCSKHFNPVAMARHQNFCKPQETNGEIHTPSKPTSRKDAVAAITAKLEAEIKAKQDEYIELQAEHEDLLALLSQQEVEKEVMKTMVVKLGGDGAFARVISSARDAILARYGVEPFGEDYEELDEVV